MRRAAAGQRAAGLGQGLGQGLGRLSTRRLRPAAANALHEAAPLAAEDLAARAVKPRKKAPARVRATNSHPHPHPNPSLTLSSPRR